MLGSSDKQLSIIEATRLIYGTRSPSQDQIRRVYKRVQAGALRVLDSQQDPLKWVTTEKWLAEYLTAQSVLKQQQGQAVEQAKAASQNEPAAAKSSSKSGGELNDLYRGMLREYFLAVILRRRKSHYSKTFERAVFAGQVVALLLLVGLMLSGVQVARALTPPEHRAILGWIDEQTDWYSITAWHPTEPAPDGQGVVVRVQYAYTKDSSRPIETDRYFRVQGDSVEEIVEEDGG